MARLPENFPDLVEHWTLLSTESDLLAGKHDGPTKLAFALLLKFYGRYGRFPRGRAELRDEVVEFVAAQVRVAAPDLGLYEWNGPTIKRHRAEIRRFFGFRTFTVAARPSLVLPTMIATSEETDIRLAQARQDAWLTIDCSALGSATDPTDWLSGESRPDDRRQQIYVLFMHNSDNIAQVEEALQEPNADRTPVVWTGRR